MQSLLLPRASWPRTLWPLWAGVGALSYRAPTPAQTRHPSLLRLASCLHAACAPQPGVRNANIQVAQLAMNSDGIVFEGGAAPISNVYVSSINVAQARAPRVHGCRTARLTAAWQRL